MSVGSGRTQPGTPCSGGAANALGCRANQSLRTERDIVKQLKRFDLSQGRQHTKDGLLQWLSGQQRPEQLSCHDMCQIGQLYALKGVAIAKEQLHVLMAFASNREFARSATNAPPNGCQSQFDSLPSGVA